jgi:hypothetical protein
LATLISKVFRWVRRLIWPCLILAWAYGTEMQRTVIGLAIGTGCVAAIIVIWFDNGITPTSEIHYEPGYSAGLWVLLLGLVFWAGLFAIGAYLRWLFLQVVGV